MLQKRPTASRIVEFGTAEDRVDIPSARPNGAAAGPARSGAGIAQIVWRRKWIILCCAIVAVAAGVVYLTQATKIYKSSSLVYIQQSHQQILGDQGAIANGMNYLQSQCAVICSTAVVQEAMKQPEIGRAQSLESAESPVAIVQTSLTATVGKQSDVITVSSESPYSEDAAVFANAVVNAYIDWMNKMHRSTAAEIVTELEKEKQKEDAEYKQISQQMLEFKQQHDAISFEAEKGNIILTRLGELDAALTSAQIDSMQQEVSAEYADSLAQNPAKLQQLMLSTPGTTGVEGGQVYRNEISQLEMQIEDLKSRYAPGYPAIKVLEQRLDEMRAKAEAADANAINVFLAGIHQRAAAAKERVSRLQREFDNQKKQAIELNAQAAQYQQLQMNLARNEKVADFLNSRIKEFQLSAENDEPNSVSVLEVAKATQSPVRPNRPQVLAIALAMGLMAGLGGALLLDWMDHRIRSAAEVEALLGLPILGAIPHMLGKRSATERGQEIHLYPRSEVAEAYRTIRTGIRFGVTDASSRTLLVTSPSPGDGKTTVASNLAIAIAQTGKRVLLIDADCRRPMVHRIHSLKDDVGLTSVLAAQSTLEDSIHHSSTESLDILPCGPLPPNPAEMLNSEAFTSLLRELANRYDQVVVDSPPIAPVTDARILGAACDATVLVIRAEKTSRRVAEHARDALGSVGAVLLGVVVNDAPRSRSESSYGHYNYGYGYGYGSKARAKEVKAIGVTPNPA